MAIDLFGPADAGAVRSVMSRPAETVDTVTIDSWFKDCEAGPGTGTPITASWLNRVTGALRTLVRRSGLAETNADDASLARAVRSQALNYMAPALVGGDVNAITLTPALPVAAYSDGLILRFIGKFTNTGPVTLNVSGVGAWPVVDMSGAALAGGEIGPGVLCQVVAVGGAWMLDTVSFARLDLRYSKLPILPDGQNVFYVSTTGSNANDGTTPAKAFRTIQYAINYISGKWISLKPVTINVAPGTYVGAQFKRSYISSWILNGNEADPGSVIIDSVALTSNNGRGIVAYDTTLDVKGIRARAYYEAINANTSSTVYTRNVIVEPPTSGVGFMVGAYAGRLTVYGNCTVIGSHADATLFGASDSGLLTFGYYDAVKTEYANIIASGSVTMGRFLNSSRSGTILFYPAPYVTFAGTFTGSKYLADLNGVIQTAGIGAANLPGTIDGTKSTGGQIL